MTIIGALLSRVATPPLAVTLAVLLAGCKVFETNAPPPEFSVPEAFDEAPACGVCLSSQDFAHWWTVWRDPTLDRLIKDALEANTDLRIAQARVAEARSLAAIVESALYPTVGAQGGQWGGAMQWNNPLVNLIPGGSHTFDAHLAGAAAGWEPDIFEGHADDAEAARAAALSVEEQLNGARMIVVAEVAENYQEARGLQRRLAVLDASIATLEQMLRYVEARYAAGQALAYDVTEVRERLEFSARQTASFGFPFGCAPTPFGGVDRSRAGEDRAPCAARDLRSAGHSKGAVAQRCARAPTRCACSSFVGQGSGREAQ